MRRTALATLGVVLAVLGVWWMAADEQRGAPRTSPTPELEPLAPEPAPARLTAADAPREDARVPSVSLAPAVAAPENAEAEPGAAPLASVPLSGTIVVVDEQGLEHAAEDGSFSFVLWTGDTGAWQEVAVAGGRWSVDLTPEEPLDGLGLEGIRLGGRAGAALPEWADRFPLPEGGTLALRVRWPPRSVLHVRDRASGRELAPVLLVEVNGWPESSLGHPGRAAERARDLGPSPVELPGSENGIVGTRTLFARSPGFAWGRVEIDEKTGGERMLELDAAGSLEVRWTGACSDPGARLRVFGTSYHPAFETELAGSAVLAEDLAPGSYAVKAQIGDIWHEPLLLAETTAEVVAGRRALASLSLAEVKAPAHVPLSGTLVVPREWELGYFELALALLDTPLAGFDGRLSISRDTMQSTDEPASVFAWSAGDVQPGRYEALLDEPGFSVVLVVGPAGLRDALIELPPPATVRVRCVEAGTGLPAEGASVTYRCRLPEGVRSWSSRQATEEDEPGAWRCRAPLGPVLLSAHGGGFGWKSTEVVVVPGFNEFVLELERLASLSVVLRDGETVVPWGDELAPELTLPGEENRGRSWSRSGGALTLHMPAGGRYTLTIPPIPGYEPVLPTYVDLAQGETREHVVELVRRP